MQQVTRGNQPPAAPTPMLPWAQWVPSSCLWCCGGWGGGPPSGPHGGWTAGHTPAGLVSNRQYKVSRLYILHFTDHTWGIKCVCWWWWCRCWWQPCGAAVGP